MRIARTFFTLLLLSSLFFSCTKEDISEDEVNIKENVVATGDKITPPNNDDD